MNLNKMFNIAKKLNRDMIATITLNGKVEVIYVLQFYAFNISFYYT